MFVNRVYTKLLFDTREQSFDMTNNRLICVHKQPLDMHEQSLDMYQQLFGICKLVFCIYEPSFDMDNLVFVVSVVMCGFDT